MSRTQFEALKRTAIFTSLTKEEQWELIEGCEQLLNERVQIAQVLRELPPSWATVRAALNELQRLLR